MRERILFNCELPASRDLTKYQYCAVRINRKGKISLSRRGEPCVGILQNKPKRDEIAIVMTIGESKAVVGSGGVTMGDTVLVSSAGRITQGEQRRRTLGIARHTAGPGQITTLILQPG